MGNIEPTSFKIKYSKYTLADMAVLDFVDCDVIAINTTTLSKPIFVYKVEPKNKSNIAKKSFNNGYLGKYKSIYYEDDLLTEDLLISSAFAK